MILIPYIRILYYLDSAINTFSTCLHSARRPLRCASRSGRWKPRTNTRKSCTAWAAKSSARCATCCSATAWTGLAPTTSGMSQNTPLACERARIDATAVLLFLFQCFEHLCGQRERVLELPLRVGRPRYAGLGVLDHAERHGPRVSRRARLAAGVPVHAQPGAV